MIQTLRLLFFGVLLMAGWEAKAQSGDCKGFKPPLKRQLFHDYVDREQRNALKADGKADNFFQAGDNEDVNYFVTQAITQNVDAIQCRIEKDSTIADQKKVAYLRGLEGLLRNFANAYKGRRFTASNFPTALRLYEEVMKKDNKGLNINDLFEKVNYEIGNLVLTCGAFDRSAGYQAAQFDLLKKYCILHPDKIFLTLKDNPDLPNRDSLILYAGYKYPRLLYDYAAASNALGYAIRNIQDPFIKAVSRMATSTSGQLYFPFLDNIIKGRQNFAQIDAVKDDDAKYYKLLVKTRIDYVKQQLDGEKVMEMESLSKMLRKKANDAYINTINGLHESPDAVRFKVLQELNAQELYYLAVFGEDALYTSSYVKGVYPLMMQRIGNRGDSLLMSVYFDRFRKFIRMAAGYNTLSSFLSSFPTKNDEAKTLMTAFVDGLERSSGLEDGVDVADSYASIAESAKPVAEQMLSNARRNYEKNVKENNKRGIVIYNLLYKLFLSATDSSIDLSKEFGIPPVYNVSYNSLLDSGKVVMQVFFYGDKDGLMNYAGFLPQFTRGGWKKIVDNKYWIAFASVKGRPIYVYANKPLDPETGELDKAQQALNNYLSDKSIQPTIVVHRGHSYWAPTTIDFIQPSAKIVYLGSCGGYNLIHDVLLHSPDAHIIASKQTGKIAINQPFFNLLMDKLQNGRNIDWIPFWKEFEHAAGKTEGFEDYIPPYKNLGAIFIKAYKSAMGDEEE